MSMTLIHDGWLPVEFVNCGNEQDIICGTLVDCVEGILNYIEGYVACLFVYARTPMEITIL